MPQLLPQCIFLQARFKFLIFYLIFILELQKLSQIEKYYSFMKYIAFRAQIWGIISFASTFDLNVFFFKLDYVIFNLIFILELQKLSQIEKYNSFMKYIAFRAQIWGIISFASTFASMFFLQARFKYLIFYLILILELQKLSQIEKYHYFMKYIAFRAQIWGSISFASTFASMYFSSS